MSVYLQLMDEFGEKRIFFKPEASPLGPNLSNCAMQRGGKARIFEGSGGINLVDCYRRGICRHDARYGFAGWDRRIVAGPASRRKSGFTRLSYPICASGRTCRLQAGLDGFLAIEKYLLVKRGLFPEHAASSALWLAARPRNIAEVDRLFALLQPNLTSQPIGALYVRHLHRRADVRSGRYQVLAFLCLSAAIAYIQRAALSVPALRSPAICEFADLARDMGWIQSAWYLSYGLMQFPAAGWPIAWEAGEHWPFFLSCGHWPRC